MLDLVMSQTPMRCAFINVLEMSHCWVMHLTGTMTNDLQNIVNDWRRRMIRTIDHQGIKSRGHYNGHTTPAGGLLTRAKMVYLGRIGQHRGGQSRRFWPGKDGKGLTSWGQHPCPPSHWEGWAYASSNIVIDHQRKPTIKAMGPKYTKTTKTLARGGVFLCRQCVAKPGWGGVAVLLERQLTIAGAVNRVENPHHHRLRCGHPFVGRKDNASPKASYPRRVRMFQQSRNHFQMGGKTVSRGTNCRGDWNFRKIMYKIIFTERSATLWIRLNAKHDDRPLLKFLKLNT